MNDDLISRQAAIDVAGNTVPSDWFELLEEKLIQLPSAQPENIFFVKTNRFLSPDELKKLEENLKSQSKNIVLLPEDCSLVYSNRKKGKWIKTIKHYDGDNMEFDYYAIRCSICGLPPEKAYHLTDYCPNCGADMRGDENV